MFSDYKLTLQYLLAEGMPPLESSANVRESYISKENAEARLAVLGKFAEQVVDCLDIRCYVLRVNFWHRILCKTGEMLGVRPRVGQVEVDTWETEGVG